MSVMTMLVVESSRKEKKSVLRLEIQKYPEDVCEPEEETGQYRFGFCSLVGLHVDRRLCSSFGENFNCFLL